ncbi:MAG: ankyrin repeat domain-containing protein [Planctomycetes bacterium]|nr:ankyrin repeat domain-containing protein [Planctomycetota bacterium]
MGQRPATSPPPEIHAAAERGDIEALKVCLARGDDIDQSADLGDFPRAAGAGLTPLMAAAASIDGRTAPAMRLLLDRGADAAARSTRGTTALWYVAARSYVHSRASSSPGAELDLAERLRLLLAKGLDPAECDRWGNSALTCFCRDGHADCVRILLEHGARPGPSVSPERARQDEIPLFCAVASGSLEIVSMLLAAGAEIGIRDNHGETALYFARAAPMIDLLLDAEVPVDMENWHGRDVVGHLLEQFDPYQWSAEERAAAETLFRRVVPKLPREAPQKWLFDATSWHHAPAVEFLLDRGIAPGKHRDGGSLLHWACFNSEPPTEKARARYRRIIERIFAAGVTVDATNDKGETPLHEAVMGDGPAPTAVETLLRLGAAVDRRDGDGNTPLHLAVRYYETQRHCVSVLLAAGADPMLLDAEGLNALMIAADKSQETHLRLLLAAGIDAAARNPLGKSALDYARETLAIWEEICGEDAVAGDPCKHGDTLDRCRRIVALLDAQRRRGPESPRRRPAKRGGSTRSAVPAGLVCPSGNGENARMPAYEPRSRRPISDLARGTAKGAVRFCVRAKIHPDVVSYSSIAASAAAAACFWFSGAQPWLLLVGPLFGHLRLWFNMLDGMVALAAGKASPRGEIINELPDRISDVLVFAGVAHSGWCAVASGYWAAILALLTAYVGVLGQAVGAKREFGGIMSKPWRMVILHAGAWAALGAAWWGDPEARWWSLRILDWTCLAIVIGCVQTIWVRLARILCALGKRGAIDESVKK